MRIPVSTPGASDEQLISRAVFSGVVRSVILPGAPQYADPGAREDADGVWMAGAAGAGALIDIGGPWAGVSGVVCPGGERTTQAMVAGPAERDATGFTRLVGDRAHASFGGELGIGLEAFAHRAEFGEQLRGIDTPGAWEGHDEVAIGQCGDGVLDARAQGGQLRDQRAEHAGQCADQLALGLGFDLTAVAVSGSAQALEQDGCALAPAVVVGGEEGGQALLTQARGAGWGGIVLEEGECDWRVERGEQRAGTGPEALQQRAQLIGQSDTPNDTESIEQWLDRWSGPLRLAMEPTNTYHLAIAHAAQARGHLVYLVDPYRLTHYRAGIGQRVKADCQDAKLLARYLHNTRPPNFISGSRYSQARRNSGAC